MRERTTTALPVLLTGLLLVLIQFSLYWISCEFAYGVPDSDKPIIRLVSLAAAAGVVYLAALRWISLCTPTRRLFTFAIAVGFVMRFFMFPTSPMLEDDHYRYLWDGAVTAHFHSPYLYSPNDVRFEWLESGIPPSLQQLAEESGTTVERINHPNLRTIYPPVAQAAFAIAYWIQPWSLPAWRVVLLGFDILALILVIRTLQSLGLPVLFFIVYWWNPLLVKEIYNSGHMDLLIFPFVIFSLWFAVRHRRYWSLLLLAVATGIKIWPILLLPVVLRSLIDKPKELLLCVAYYFALVLVLFLPVIAGGLESDSGFTAYGKRWEMNDALFMVFLWGTKAVLDWLGGDIGHAQLIARFEVTAILVLWIAWLLKKPVISPRRFYECSLYIVAAMFLLSPTQFPWYYTWLVPLLAIQPRWSLLLLTPLLSLYYLRFYFETLGRVSVFDNGIVWLEYIPVWALLIWEWIGRRRGRTVSTDAE